MHKEKWSTAILKIEQARNGAKKRESDCMAKVVPWRKALVGVTQDHSRGKASLPFRSLAAIKKKKGKVKTLLFITIVQAT